MKEIVSGTHSVITLNIEAQFFSRLSLHMIKHLLNRCRGVFRSKMELFFEKKKQFKAASYFF